MSSARKLVLALRIWARYAVVRYRLRREPLPELAASLGRTRRLRPSQSPERLARAVDRALRLGRWRPTCLASSLVLVSLLREQGEAAELVIGLPEKASDHEAHAWVELGAVDVGPPPGRGRHVEMARFA